MNRLPNLYTLDALRESLDDNSALIEAFIWEDSEQGHSFWSAQHEYGLAEEGRAVLLEMIAAAEALEAVAAAEDEVPA